MNPALYQLLETYYKKRRLTLIITAGHRTIGARIMIW